MVAPRIVALAVGNDLDVAVGRSGRQGAVVLAIGPAQDADAPARARASSSWRPTWANSGSVKVTRGTLSSVDPDRQPEQRMADHQPGMVSGQHGSNFGPPVTSPIA